MFIGIEVSFIKTKYEVNESVGSIAPQLVLNHESPCCITIRAKLENITAEGESLHKS